MTTENLRARFETRKPSSEAGGKMARLRTQAADLAEKIDEAAPNSREKSLAITSLEQALFWANKAIIVADNARETADPPYRGRPIADTPQA